MQANAPVEVKEYAKGLTQPFGMARLPNGKILVTERPGNLRVISTDGALSEPLQGGVPKVAFNNQGGLLDVALDPKFESNGLIYASYSEPQSDNTNNTAVFRARFIDGPAPRLENVTVIYHQQPSLQSPLHFGSRLVFARDGTLFVTQGERSILPGRVQAQDLKSGLGKIVRINTDGTIPKDNPFIGKTDARPEIWSYGHRNVQGAFLHPATGELWSMEHGPQGGDEINIARKGVDYGWPSITYGAEYGPANTRIGEGPQKAGLQQPVYYWDPVIAPGAMMYYSGSAIPKWKNSIFVTGLNSNYVARLTLNAAGDKVIGEERLTFADKRERYRDIEQASDGSIFLLTDGPAANARVLRIAASPSGSAIGAKAWEAPPPPAPRAAAVTPAPAPLPAPQAVGGPAAAPPAVEPGASLLALVTLPATNNARLSVSTAGWKNMEDIPYEFTQYRTNTFPGLEWTKGPAATKSYAVIMQDTDLVMRGSPILHWSMVNVPPTVTRLDKGMAPEGKPASAIYGPNYQGANKPYLGPRTPPGPKHRYHIQVLALDTMLPADFAPKNYDELIAPMKGHVVASGEVVGLGQADPSAPPPPPRPAPAAPATPPATPN